MFTFSEHGELRKMVVSIHVDVVSILRHVSHSYDTYE